MSINWWLEWLQRINEQTKQRSMLHNQFLLCLTRILSVFIDSAHSPLWSRLLSISESSLSFSSSDTIASSSSSVLFFGSHVILFSFLRRRRAFANHVDTWVSVIFVMIASMIFSPFVGYGFFLCSLSHALSVAVDSRVAFLRRAARSYPAPYLVGKKRKTKKSSMDLWKSYTFDFICCIRFLKPN